jgi:hypothetical protein
MSDEWPGQRYRLSQSDRWPIDDDTPVLPHKPALIEAHRGLTKQIGTFVVDEAKVIGETCRRNIYRIPDPAWEYMRGCVENSDSMLPCGHRGLRNTPEGYACALDLCDKLFTREEVDA